MTVRSAFEMGRHVHIGKNHLSFVFIFFSWRLVHLAWLASKSVPNKPTRSNFYRIRWRKENKNEKAKQSKIKK